ncbi:MAG: hypothetical protein U0529_03420 [Thermoanaerobaculia bacterium]
MHLPDPVGIAISIVFMAVTIVVSAGAVLKVRPLPILRALVIASVSNLLGKLLVSVLHWPALVSYAIPTAAYFALSVHFFRPTLPRLVAYWVSGFALYLAIHVVLTNLLGWSFMFPFWRPRLLASPLLAFIRFAIAGRP